MLPLSRRSLCSAGSRICTHGSTRTRVLLPQLTREAIIPPQVCQRNYATRVTKSKKGGSAKQKEGSTGTEQAATPARDPLGLSRAEEFLQQIGSGSRQAALADIERFKPATYAAPGSARYEQEYATLIDTLMRTFSLDQFRQFVSLYHLDPPKGKRTKWHYVATIVEKQWGWPSVAELRQKRKEWTEIVFKSFPLNVHEALMILGKDGSDLLALSSKYNVHVSFSPNPLALKVEGIKASVDKLTEHVDGLKKEMTEELFALPAKATVDPATLRRISRAAGVSLESPGDGMIRIFSRSSLPHAAHFAKNSLIQAISSARDKHPLFVDFSGNGPTNVQPADTEQNPVKGGNYALYPFFSRQTLPAAVGSPNIFRLRAIERRFGTIFDDPTSRFDENQIVHGLTRSENRLQDVLADSVRAVSRSSHPITEISVTFGHVVIDHDNLRPTILPPLLGSQDPVDVIEFLSTYTGSRLFLPSVPTVLSRTSMSEPRMFHRLVYRALSTTKEQPSPSCPNSFMSFTVSLNAKGTAQTSSNEAWSNAARRPKLTMEPIFKVGSILDLDLAMPSRSMDVRLTCTSTSEIDVEHWPSEVREYYTSLQTHLTTGGLARPDPPLFLKQDGTTYALDVSSNIRQEDHSLEDVDEQIANTVEGVLDLGSGEKHKRCRVSYAVDSSAPSFVPLFSVIDLLNTPPRVPGNSTTPTPRNEEKELF